jgi:hypothetical protein
MADTKIDDIVEIMKLDVIEFKEQLDQDEIDFIVDMTFNSFNDITFTKRLNTIYHYVNNISIESKELLISMIIS